MDYPENDYRYYLMHYGVPGMKHGVRNGPPYPIKRNTVPTKIVSGHKSTPKKSTPNSVMDHKSPDGKIDKRTYYGNNGLIEKEIHTGDHRQPKNHRYGQSGEHAHDFIWNSDGTLKKKTTREIRKNERKENKDIL